MATTTRRSVISAAAVRPQAGGRPAAEPKRAGLVVRVSTDRQAANDEGSLRNQLQRLHAHIDYRVQACGERWTEVAVYELRAVSGKVSLRSPEMERLMADIRAGRVDTVLCTALDRISRSVSDFLNFFELLNRHETEFVCLKQNYDTTSAQGKLFATIMMALAEFEREMTSERTADATAARAERGLFNGGQLLGYDPDPARKGYLKVNEAEAEVVRAMFDTYLEVGSMARTIEVLNEHGYRSKTFTSRAGIAHAGKKFQISTVQSLLKNPSYIGLKPVNARKRAVLGDPEAADYHLVPAVWPPIVDPEKFDEVQRLMAANGRTRTNQARVVRHSYVLNSGLLWCRECGAQMEGRSGTGRQGKVYFYYACMNRECGMRVSAEEIEGVILERLRILATADDILTKLVAATNQRLNSELPILQKRKRALGRELSDVRGQADRLISELPSFGDARGRSFVTTKLGELEDRRQEIESAIAEVDEALRHIQTSALTAGPIREALAQITKVYAQLKPLEQKELFRLLLHKAEVSERKIVLQVRGDVLTGGEALRPGEKRFKTPDRLPESITQSVVLYEFPVCLRGLRVAKRLREQRLAGTGSLVCSI